jgi:hypothetical protein
MSTRKVKKKIPPGIKADVLKAIHDAGYVCNESLAAIYRVNPVITWRVLKELERDKFVRMVGEPFKCPYHALVGKRFYTPTNVDIKDACEEITITPFKPEAEKHDPGEIVPGADLLVRRFAKDVVDSDPQPKVDGIKKKRNRKQKAHEECISVHWAGAHVAAGFFASTINPSESLVDTRFVPERVLRREKFPIYPMPDGLFFVNGKENCYRLEFERYKKATKRYTELFDRLETCSSPTVYIVLTPKLTLHLDDLARNRKNIAIVILGDEEGCASALKGLIDGNLWQPPERYLTGKKAGFDRVADEAEDKGAVPPPGLRHLDLAAVARLKAALPVLSNV